MCHSPAPRVQGSLPPPHQSGHTSVTLSLSQVGRYLTPGKKLIVRHSHCSFLPFSAAPYEKRSARHFDHWPARGVVCLDLPQTCERAITLLGCRVEPGPAALRRPLDSSGIGLAAGVGRQPERQRPAPFRGVLPFLRSSHSGEFRRTSSGGAWVRSPGALLYQLRGLRRRPAVAVVCRCGDDYCQRHSLGMEVVPRPQPGLGSHHPGLFGGRNLDRRLLRAPCPGSRHSGAAF